MNAPLFITSEKKQSTLPLLIVDKQALLSKGLISVLSEHFTTVLVSKSMPLPHLSRIVHVPFKRTIPQIPDNYFSSIMVFYSGEKAIEDSIHSFITKAKQNEAKLIVITSQEHANLPFLKKAAELYSHFHILIYGDVFGVSRNEDSLVTHMMHEAHLTRLITIHGSGLSESYPIYYADMLQGMLHMLLSHQPPRVGFLFPARPVTEIHLARLILKLYPQADLAFVREKNQEKAPAITLDGEQLLEEPYPLGEKLQHLRMPPPNGPLRKSKRGKAYAPAKERKLLTFSLITLFCLSLLTMLTFVFFLIGIVQLHAAVQAGKNGELITVQKRATTAATFFQTAENTSGILTAVGTGIGLGKQVGYYHQNIRAARTVSSVVQAGADAGIAYTSLLKDKSLNPKESMIRVSSDLKQVILGISQLQAENSLPQTYAAQLAAFKKPLQQVSGIIDVLPQLAGVGVSQKYLVLFQNNMELRPGGGFIGSYGLLTLKDGRMESFTVHDVYDADGQLTGHIEPPFGLKRYLGAAHLFLRDSNFDVEFSQNAAQAAFLLNASTDVRVDGVITMDVSFLKTLLERIGPVYLPAYDETVSAKNFYMLVQSHAENDFFPGSSQKKDFLQHVAQALILSMQDREQLPYIGLVEAFEQAVSQKHLMITSANPELRTLFAKNNFAPTVTKNEMEKQASIDDFLGVFDANIGTNKTNYYMKRSITQNITLADTGERKETLTLRYTNSSTKDSPFGGDYKNYLRLVLPEGTIISSISIDGVNQPIISAITNERVYESTRFTPPAGIEVEEETRYGRSLFGFLLTVPTEQTRQLVVSYTEPQVNALPDAVSYVLRVFKQPGTDFDPYHLTFTYPSSYTLTSSPDFAGHTGSSLKVTTQLAEDILFPLTFTK